MSYYDVDAILTDAEVQYSRRRIHDPRVHHTAVPCIKKQLSLTSGGPSSAPAQKVPCQFELDAPDLGHLDSSSSTGLKPGTALTLPLWLAEMLALASTGGSGEDARAPLTLNLPPCLSERVANALKADPRAVALRDQSAHFYGVGVRMLDLFDERELGAVLRRTFVLRAADVGLHARKADETGVGGGASAGASGEEFLRGLDEWERGLFRRGHDGVRGAREWMDKVKKG
ncbi:Psf3 protein [Purpureocillium lavendulum]|uniref:DNA replication complex GINS protein PSF3 n=1 Tax=Purpureocillium lavendulum TaxID=1247861 RepID=A0AB34FPJ7_9HYPO|nr:Psf3 protein [Purpureocillium lavendulum]